MSHLEKNSNQNNNSEPKASPKPVPKTGLEDLRLNDPKSQHASNLAEVDNLIMENRMSSLEKKFDEMFLLMTDWIETMEQAKRVAKEIPKVTKTSKESDWEETLLEGENNNNRKRPIKIPFEEILQTPILERNTDRKKISTPLFPRLQRADKSRTPPFHHDRCNSDMQHRNENRRTKLNIPPPKFDGSKDAKAEDFIKDFEKYARLSGWSDLDKVEVFSFHLDGIAKDWVNSIPTDLCYTWADLLEEFRAQFCSYKKRSLYEREYFQCEQKFDESVLSYSIRLRKAAVKLNRPVDQEELGEKFKNGVLRQYRPYLINPELKTLEDSILFAQQLEGVFQQDAQRRSFDLKRKDLDRNIYLKPTSTDSGHQKSENAKPPTSRADIECFNCHKKGHYSSQCPEKKEVQKPGSRVNFIEEEDYASSDEHDLDEEDLRQTEPDTEIISMVSDQTTEFEPATIKIEITKIGMCSAIIDTGASISLIRTNVAIPLKDEFPHRKFIHKRLITASRETMGTDGEIQLRFLISGREFVHWMIVVPNLPAKILLGNDFLSRFPFSINPFEKTLILGSLQIPMRISRFTKEKVNLIEEINRSEVKELTVEEMTASLPLGVDIFTGRSLTQNLIRLWEVLVKNKKAFSANVKKPGFTDIVEHDIPTGDARPIKMLPYRKSPAENELIKREIDAMLEADLIFPCSSPWAFPVVLADKADGTKRFCIDYKRLNVITKTDAYPMPRVDDLIDQLREAKFFSTMDLVCGYWQIKMKEEDIEKTTFTCAHGTFAFKRMPFGLKNAPATFQRMMNRVLASVLRKFALVYLDDIIVYSVTWTEHLQHLEKVFQLLIDNKLQLKGSKCKFGLERIKFLGHVINENGIFPNEEKIAIIKNLIPPEDLRGLRRFLGMCSYYRRFIPEFSTIAASLNLLLRSGQKWKWEEKQQKAFDDLKSRMITAPVLRMPDFNMPFILSTDASEVGLGAVLSQKEEKGEFVVSYASRTLSKAERNYSTTEKECLAVIWAVAHFRPYLYGRKFTIVTDHAALVWLINFKGDQQRLIRWSLKLQEYDFEIKYRPGTGNAPADALSRIYSEKVQQVNYVNVVQSDVKELIAMQTQDLTLKILLEKAASKKDSEFVFIEKVLYRQIKDRKSQVMNQIILPAQLRHLALEECHDNRLTGGHLGQKKVLQKLYVRYWWPNIRKDVLHWIRSCKICSLKKDPKILTKTELQSIPVGLPWETLGIDVLGPLRKTENGNKYIVVISDYLTKWPEAYPMKEAKTETIAKILVEEVFCRFGIPSRLLSDRGAAFLSDVMAEILKLLSVKKVNTSPYHPQTDGLVERFNRTLIKLLSVYVDKKQSDWDVHLPYVMFAYRTSIQRSVGEEPFFLMFGRRSRYPIEISYTPYTQIGRSYHLNFSDAWEFAKENIEKAQLNQKRNADKDARHREFKVGDLVMLRIVSTTQKNDQAKKFIPKWSGPHVIEQILGQDLYHIKDLESIKRQDVHANLLKPFEARKVLPSLQLNEDVPTMLEKGLDEEFEVEEILGKKKIYSNSGTSETHYLVKWKGYPESSNSWEPHHALNCPELLSKFREGEKRRKAEKGRMAEKEGMKGKSTSKILVQPRDLKDLVTDPTKHNGGKSVESSIKASDAIPTQSNQKSTPPPKKNQLKEKGKVEDRKKRPEAVPSTIQTRAKTKQQVLFIYTKAWENQEHMEIHPEEQDYPIEIDLNALPPNFFEDVEEEDSKYTETPDGDLTGCILLVAPEKFSLPEDRIEEDTLSTPMTTEKKNSLKPKPKKNLSAEAAQPNMEPTKHRTPKTNKKNKKKKKYPRTSLAASTEFAKRRIERIANLLEKNKLGDTKIMQALEENLRKRGELQQDLAKEIRLLSSFRDEVYSEEGGM